MTDLNAPVAHSGETLVHLHFINPATNDRSTYIGEAASQRLRQDTATFRRTLDVSIDLGPAIDLAWYAENYGDTEWMVHIEGPDDCITHKDEAATVPLTEKDARDLALAVNMTAVSEREASEFAPFMHATVFHNGVPVVDPAPIDVTEVRKALIAESYALLQLGKEYHATIEEPVVTTFELSVLSAILKANAYSYLLAAVLRRVEASEGVAAASEMAQWFETVMDVGNEVLEDANADLDEQAVPVGPETAPAVAS